MSRKPTDTTIDMPLNALGMLCAGSNWIDTQEKRGAEEAVASESLPSDISGRSQWEALGFVFGEPFAEDPMFCPVKMPLGWSKQRTEHSMHNNIVDAAGNTRGSFFYKVHFSAAGRHENLCAIGLRIQPDGQASVCAQTSLASDGPVWRDEHLPSLIRAWTRFGRFLADNPQIKLGVD